jgi:hypothetical protein
MITKTGSVEGRWWRLRAEISRLSTAAAARQIGIADEQLTAIEITGNVSALTEEQMRRAAELYGVRIGFLRGW